MTDRTGGDAPDGSDDSDSGSDPFEYPADEATARSSISDASDSESGGSDSPSGAIGWIRYALTTDSGALVYVRDAATSVLIVVAIGLLLFAASGVWPPMVAVISDSMEPNMQRGDLVFIVDNERFVPEDAVAADGGTTGVVPAERAPRTDHTEFNRPGDVIVFHRNGNDGGTPIIHRAMFWVEAGENWYDRADPAAIGGADNCEQLGHCPAPHAGFITKGDNELTNPTYDQVSRLSAPVRPGWIVGTAELRVPYLGHVRLLFSGLTGPLETASAAEERVETDDHARPATAVTEPDPASPRPA